MFRKKITALF